MAHKNMDAGGDSVVPCKFVRPMLRFLETQGVDIAVICEEVELPFNPLDEQYSGEELIASKCYSLLYQRAVRVARNESVGLHAPTPRPVGTFRLMGYALINCKNLEHAIGRAANFNEMLKQNRQPDLISRRLSSKLPQGWPLRREMDATGRLVATYFYDTDANSVQQMGGEALLGIASGIAIRHRFCSWLIDHPIELIEVMFAGGRPDNIEKYQKFFNCPLKFNQSEDGFRFDAKYLDFPVLQTEDSLREFLRDAPFAFMAMPNYGKSIASQIRSLISRDVGKKFPSFERVAELLGLSESTLWRRLQQENISYQDIKDNCQRDTALVYLLRPELSIGAVARLMGFNDASSFHRSFKKWTGLTPKEYRSKGIEK